MRREKNQQDKQNKKGISLILSIVLVFFMLGAVVFSVARKITVEMSTSAIHNLSESLGLVKGTIEAILSKEAEFQKMIAQELTMMEDPESFIRSYNRNRTMARISLIFAGETKIGRASCRERV